MNKNKILLDCGDTAEGALDECKSNKSGKINTEQYIRERLQPRMVQLTVRLKGQTITFNEYKTWRNTVAYRRMQAVKRNIWEKNLQI